MEQNGEGVCNKCADDDSIVSIAQILSESLIYLLFFGSIEWINLSWCDPDKCESSRNLCDFKLQNFCAQRFNFKIIFAFSKMLLPPKFHFHFSLIHVTPIACRIDWTSFWQSQICHSCSHCYTLILLLR